MIVLGDSLSDVDASYFHTLLAQPSVVQAQWTIAVRDLNEWPEKQSLPEALKLSQNHAKPILWQDI